MFFVRRFFLIVATAWAVAVPSAVPSLAQTGDAEALNKQIVQLEQAGKYAQATPLAQQLVAIYEKALGPDHPNVAMALNNLAGLYDDQGRYADAEPLYKRALAIVEKALGPEHIYVAMALNNLAEVYAEQGRYAEAEPLLKRSLAIREKTRGLDHPDVATALNNVASLYEKQGRYAEAEPLYNRSLAIREKSLGPDHPLVAQSLSNLAGLYEKQGRYAEAEPLYKRSLGMYEKALGLDHPDLGQLLNNLAGLYDDQGRYAEAEPLYKRALGIYEKALGPDHPRVAQSLNNLAGLYEKQGRYADAESLYKRSLAIYEKALGLDHPDVAQSLNNLASLYADQGRYADAEPLLKRSLAIREKVLGPDHPDVAQSLDSLALLYLSQGRYADAEPLNKRALTIVEKALGAYHPNVATLLNNLAELYYKQGRYADAEPLFKRSQAIREKALGPDHPDVAESLNNLAGLYDDQGRYTDAEPLYKRSLAIFEKALGPEHHDVATALSNLALLYNNQGRYADALPLVRRTIVTGYIAPGVALPVLFGAQSGKLITEADAFADGLNIVQLASQTAAGQALNALAVRFSAGSGRLAQLVRNDQDLAGEAANLDKAILAAVSQEPAKRNAAAEQQIRDRSTGVARQRRDLQNVFAEEFPDYAALSNPQPLKIKDIQALLADDEAIVVVHLDNKTSYVWAVTNSAANWKQLNVTADQISKTVAGLRVLLTTDNKPFDPRLSFELYSQMLGPVEDIIRSKQRLSFVVNGALTSLPPQVLVTSDPAGRALKDVQWLIRGHAVTILPSVASLKVLRGKTVVTAEAAKPLIGFANPIFDRKSSQQNARLAANVTAERGLRGTVADLAELAEGLPALPETANELRRVAASVKAPQKDVVLGLDATETRVKRTQLDQYRIVYFATHGLLAGEVAEYAKLNAEPALVLSLPEKPTDFDDGLLTASEVAQLKLNADWVVLSACLGGETWRGGVVGPGARVLLCRRSLVVSNWAVDSDSAVALMASTFAALAANPKLSHGEALQQSMLAMIDDTQHPDWADPKYWAPFVVVGEPAKPAK